MNSCLKGKRVERECSNYLTANGIPTVRAARNGVKDGQDVMLPPEYDAWIEVKGDQSVIPGTLAMTRAIEQSARGAEAHGKTTSCVLHRKNRRGWLLTYAEASGRQITLGRKEDIIDFINRTKATTASSCVDSNPQCWLAGQPPHLTGQHFRRVGESR